MWFFPADSSDATLYFYIKDSTTGAAKTGLAFNSAGALASYNAPRGNRVAITLASLAAADSAHSDGGFKEVDATNQPGTYRFDLPDAAIASTIGAYVIVQLVFDDAIVEPVRVYIDPLPDVQPFTVVDHASNSNTTFETDLTTSVTDHYNNAFLLFRTGANAQQLCPITGFTPATNFITVSGGFGAEPAAGDKGIIVNR